MEKKPFSFANAPGLVPRPFTFAYGLCPWSTVGEFKLLHGAQRALHAFMKKKRMKAAISDLLLPE